MTSYNFMKAYPTNASSKKLAEYDIKISNKIPAYCNTKFPS